MTPETPTTSASAPGTILTRIGDLSYEDGFPTKETVATLYDEMDFQRAVMAYQYAEPLVALNEMNVGFKQVGVLEGDLLLMERFLDPHGVTLTGNSTTIYGMAFLDLDKNGPMVVEVPPGSYGAFFDLWQQPIGEIGPTGADKGAGGKFVVVPIGFTDTVPDDYFTITSRTTLTAIFLRGIVKDNDVAAAAKSLEPIRLYPLSQRDNPPRTTIVPATGKDWYSISPEGLDYWRRVAEVLNRVQVDQDGAFLLSLLKPVGIEPGKPFNPDGRQMQILTDASQVGWAMDQVLSMSPRSEDATYYPGTQWEAVLLLDPGLEKEFWRELELRTNYYWQATMAAPAMKTKAIGAGSQYLRSARDSSGDWLDGGKAYSLHVPADPPAQQFWSITAYDYQTRSQIKTDTNNAAKSSADPLIANPDGSIDLYFGPQAPAGKGSNWVQTLPGRGWWVWFRFYGPTEPFFDKTWQLPDFELVK